MLHCSGATGRWWVVPCFVRTNEAKQFNLGFIRSDNLVAHRLFANTKQLTCVWTVGRLPSSHNATKPRSVKGCSDGCLSGPLSPLRISGALSECTTGIFVTSFTEAPLLSIAHKCENLVIKFWVAPQQTNMCIQSNSSVPPLLTQKDYLATAVKLNQPVVVGVPNFAINWLYLASFQTLVRLSRESTFSLFTTTSGSCLRLPPHPKTLTGIPVLTATPIWVTEDVPPNQ